MSSVPVNKNYKVITTKSVFEMKQSGQKIAMLTAYDFSMAKMVDAAVIDIILVGDSGGNVMAGYPTTLPVTLDEMIYHASAVVRGVKRALVIADLPFGSYQSDANEALRSAIRMMKESGVHGVKLEGGEEIRDSVQKIIGAGIPVMGHLGLTPQSIYKFGSYEVRAKEKEEADQLLKDAELLETLGCFAVVLEKIPALLGKTVAERLKIPAIGIGAGKYTDGQVLVIHDMLGINKDFSPRFVRRYLDLNTEITEAVARYASDVRTRKFPNDEEGY